MTDENQAMLLGTMKCLAVDIEMMRRGCCPLNDNSLGSMASRIGTMLEIAGISREELAAFVKGEIIDMVGPEEYETEEGADDAEPDRMPVQG
jgi:hypothetical protein